MFASICLYPLLLPLFVHCSETTLPPMSNKTMMARDPTCEQMKFNNMSLLAVGQVRDQEVVLITANYQMYSINETHLSAQHLNLFASQPVSLTEKWPAQFGRDIRAKKANVNETGLFVTDASSMYLVLSTNDEPVWYDIDHKKTLLGMHIAAEYHVLISTSVNLQFYAIRMNVTSGDLQMAQLKLNGNSVAKSSNIAPVSSFYTLCGHGESAVLVMNRSEDSCKEKLRWPDRMTGFVGKNGSIYLFGGGQMLTFPEKVFTERGNAQPMTKKSSRDYVQCSGGGSILSEDEDVVLKLCLTITFSLLALIAILSCLLCCFQEGLGLKRRKSQEKERKLKLSYRSCLKVKSPVGTLKRCDSQSASPEKSNGLGNRLYSKSIIRGNVGIMEKINSSEGIHRTKRILSAMEIGFEKSMRRSFSNLSVK